ncbi:MAG: polysaccharide deacetylase family protein [candidate division WOR-3 bacterium]
MVKLLSEKPILTISPIKGHYDSALAISFDYETSAPYGNFLKLNCRIRGILLDITNKLGLTRKDLSFYWGLGFAMRYGSYNILKILKRYKVHATWFATGHALIKENRKKKAFRINQLLPYATREAGFSSLVTWRKDLPTFYFEPYSDYQKYPYWYFGDLSEQLKQSGEDIQCHTFSHPYIALEPPENVLIDTEDWQNAALANGYKSASILSFPFGGDAYRYYPDLGLKTMLGKNIPAQKFELINLSPSIIEILKKCGIELLTRCGSKFDEGSLTISQYNNSSLYYLPDFDFSTLNFGKMDNILNRIISNNGIINIWLHPCNVFTEDEKKKFENLVRYLKTKEEQGLIWLAPIFDIWNHYQKTKSCHLKIETSGDKLKVIVINNNQSDIEELALDLNLRDIELINSDNNILKIKDRLIIKKIGAGSNYKFMTLYKKA